MPVERPGKAADLTVPGRDGDAAERRRVLNVLAQRRYRKRKREHLRELESKLKEAASPNQPHDNCPQSPTGTGELHSSSSSDRRPLHFFTVAQEPSLSHGNMCQPKASCLLDSQGAPYQIINGSTAAWESTAAIENPIISSTHQNPPNYAIDLGYDGASKISPARPGPEVPANSIHPTEAMVSLTAPNIDLSDFNFESDPTFLEGGLAGVSWTTLSGFIPQRSSRHGRLRIPSGDANSLSPNTSTSSSSSPSTRPTPKTLPDCLHHDPDLEEIVQLHRLQHFTFEDSYNLRVLELDLLRGCMTIAKRLNLSDIIWSLHETSPFTDPANADLTYEHLPLNLQPTLTQRTLPHHPILDLLPWPTVRNKMIHVLSQTPDLRPPGTHCPTALMDFVYDIEDSAEGVRIWGDEPCDWQNWEIGEKVFGKWWWAFDGEIIKNSNEWRISRGAPVLGQVLGEVC